MPVVTNVVGNEINNILNGGAAAQDLQAGRSYLNNPRGKLFLNYLDPLVAQDFSSTEAQMAGLA